MQARMLDFKQPLEANLSKVNNDKDFKSNDFSKKLNSANENNNSVKKQYDKEKSNIKSNQEKDVQSTDKEKVSKGEKEDVPVEEVKKEDVIQYENMVNLLNIKEIEENPEVEIKEIDEVIETVEIIETNIISNENMELEDEILLEENSRSINPKESKINPENSKELIKEKPIELGEKETKAELITENVDKKEIIVEVNEFEEISTGEEENVLNVRESSSKKTNEKSPDNNQEESTDSGKSYELVDGSISEESPEVSNESFGPIIKNGLEFSTDNTIDSEMPQVEAKEVVKQIVDQVKFDLSESKNEIKLSLKPEALGEMTMNIELAKDGIVARIMVDSYKTKEVIESNIFQLKEGLKDTGLEIKTFEVFVGNGSDFDQHDSNQFNFNQNNKKLKIKNQDNKKSNNFIEGYEEGTVNKSSGLDGKILEGSLNLFA